MIRNSRKLATFWDKINGFNHEKYKKIFLFDILDIPLLFILMQREALLTKAAMHITQLINTGENICISHKLSLVAAESSFSLQLNHIHGVLPCLWVLR